MAKILYVEDDLALAESVKEWLEAESHVVEAFESAEDALQLVANFSYEVVLLDWDLPGVSGLDFCARYRKSGGGAWVIFLTGKDDIGSIEAAFNLGGDDYVAKPFHPRELSARVNASLRRAHTAFQSDLSVDDVRLDRQNRRLFVGEKEVHLMPKESALMEFLLRNLNVIFSTKDLLAAVWSSENDVSEGVVRTYVRQLRKKLDAVGRADLIESNAGRGYVIRSK